MFLHMQMHRADAEFAKRAVAAHDAAELHAAAEAEAADGQADGQADGGKPAHGLLPAAGLEGSDKGKCDGKEGLSGATGGGCCDVPEPAQAAERCKGGYSSVGEDACDVWMDGAEAAEDQPVLPWWLPPEHIPPQFTGEWFGWLGGCLAAWVVAWMGD